MTIVLLRLLHKNKDVTWKVHIFNRPFKMTKKVWQDIAEYSHWHDCWNRVGALYEPGAKLQIITRRWDFK
jgi:hypothetical protein